MHPEPNLFKSLDPTRFKGFLCCENTIAFNGRPLELFWYSNARLCNFLIKYVDFDSSSEHSTEALWHIGQRPVLSRLHPSCSAKHFVHLPSNVIMSYTHSWPSPGLCVRVRSCGGRIIGTFAARVESCCLSMLVSRMTCCRTDFWPSTFWFSNQSKRNPGGNRWKSSTEQGCEHKMHVICSLKLML